MKQLGWIVSALFLPVFLFSGCHSDAPADRLPNVVYILADDAGYGDFGVYGQTKFDTPNVDRIANEGIRFTQHYAGSTVCAPSRSVLMTGLHTGHTYIRGNKAVQPEGQWPLPDSVYTLAEMMQDAGYVTGAFGKWGLGYPGSEGDPMNQGFDRFFGYNCQRIAHTYYPDTLWDNNRQIPLPGNVDGGTGTYSRDLITEQALNFIENPDAPIELYDLREDIGETNNVASEHPDVVDEMARLMEDAHEPSEVFPGFDK